MEINPHKQARGNTAFTLLEMLASTAVLGVLVILTAQLVNGVSRATLGSGKRIESDATSRTALGILSNDFGKMVQRPMGDVDYLFAKLPGNDKLFFYSEAPGYSSTPLAKGTVSLVGYRVNEQFQLERLGKALPLSGTGSMVFLFSGTSPTNLLVTQWPATLGSAPDYNGSDTDYSVISPEIFRMEFCFMKKTGGYFEPSSAWKPWADDDRDGIPNINEIGAVVVTVACLDKASRQLVSNMQTLAATLPDSGISSNPLTPTTDSTKLPAAIWKQEIESPGFASKAGIPQTAASAVRVYQRQFSVNGW